jgi:hypothetical protein
MGFFDFLNPKKAIEKKISRTVERQIGPELRQLKALNDPNKRRSQLTRMVEQHLQRQANEVIPASLRKHSRLIIKSASKNLVAKLEQQLSAQAPAAPNTPPIPAQ